MKSAVPDHDFSCHGDKVVIVVSHYLPHSTTLLLCEMRDALSCISWLAIVVICSMTRIVDLHVLLLMSFTLCTVEPRSSKGRISAVF